MKGGDERQGYRCSLAVLYWECTKNLEAPCSGLQPPCGSTSNVSRNRCILSLHVRSHLSGYWAPNFVILSLGTCCIADALQRQRGRSLIPVVSLTFPIDYPVKYP